jgi:hypothetical protein
MSRASFRRSSVFAVAALSLAASVGARPFAKGVTYRVRISSRLPAIMAGGGGDASGPLVLARASAVGNRARFDLQAFQPMPPDLSLDDYLLVVDSAQTVFVKPEDKTYVDAARLVAGGGLGMLRSMIGGRRGAGAGAGAGGTGGGTPQMDMSGLVSDFEFVGRDTTDGKPTRHYRVVAEMTIAAMGRQVPLRVLIETWTADLPYHIVNPFDVAAASSPNDPTAKLMAKLAEYRRKIEGTPIKTVTTSTISIDVGGGPMMLDFTQTTQITDIKEADVDEKQLEIPAGFVKRP